MLGKVQHVPVVFRDEFVYGGLAEWIANGKNGSFRAEGVNSLFPYLLAPAWQLTSSVPEGYALAKVFTATMYTLSIVPLWLALRRPIGAWVALIPCVLLLAAPWSGDSSKMLTESLALPVVTSAIAMLWWALRSPDRARAKLLAALGLVVVAAMVRVHLAALIPAFALAIVLDAFRRPRADRAIALRRFAPELIVAAAIAVGGLLVVFMPSLQLGLGIYESVKSFGFSGLTLQRTLEYFMMMGIYGALLPPIAFIALAITRSAWRDTDVGSLLAIIIATALVMLPFVGWFSAGIGTTVVERYAMYLIPWLLAMPFLGLRVLSAAHVLIATLIVAVVVVMPITLKVVGVAEAYVEGRRAFGEFFGIFDHRSGASIVFLALVLGAIYALCVDRTPSEEDEEDLGPAWLARINQGFAVARRSVGAVNTAGVALAIGAILLIITVPLSSARWNNLAAIGDRHMLLLPQNLDWVDEAVGSDRSVSMVALGEDLPSVPNEQTDFFNSSVNAMYVQNPRGGNLDVAPCLVDLHIDGRLTGRQCADPSTAILAVGNLFRFSLQDGKVIAAKSDVGTLMTTKQRPVRLRTLVAAPCSPETTDCKGRMTVRLWTERPSVLKVIFQGEGEPGNTVLVNDRFYDIPASGKRRIKLDLPAGTQEIKFQLSWLTPQYNPTINSITLDGEEIYAIER